MNLSLSIPPSFTVMGFDTLGSTNDEAKQRAANGAVSHTVIWARQQTAGRGRRGRSWGSPPGNLYCSIVIRLQDKAAQAGQLSFVAALSIAEAVRAVVPLSSSVQVKWPNDVLVNKAKISGLLLEADLAASDPWVVIGMGINLVFHPEGTPYSCTDLVQAGGDILQPEDMLTHLLISFQKWEKSWKEKGFGSIREAWKQQAFGLGQSLIARLPQTEIQGVFEELDTEGALILRDAQGKQHRILTADIFFHERA